MGSGSVAQDVGDSADTGEPMRLRIQSATKRGFQTGDGKMALGRLLGEFTDH